MTTYHIHINGQVQGVGFRPFVYQLAEKMGVHGWVSNTNDGVHIEFSATPGVAAQFYHSIISSPPVNAIVTDHHIHEVAAKTFSSFDIRQSIADSKPNLMLTPDIALCPNCKKEVLENVNRWFKYPFTTCLHCGPRYSIITQLPYDRENTTMAPLKLCDDCIVDYNDVHNRRHYSQTMSCPQCAIKMHLYNANGIELTGEQATILANTEKLLREGNIVAVKGVGGYLLLCDAANPGAIATLRTRKHRPARPFALLYPNIERIKADAELKRIECDALQEKSAPIVLCRLKPGIHASSICANLIAPGLDKIGVMVPYTPLLLLISDSFNGPLIATSGNISGSPIIFRDRDALQCLSAVADYILSYDREIVLPQDDSVIQFVPTGQKIILRRSRGLAPNYYPNPFRYTNEPVLAMGGELKSSFAILNHHNLYVSQYLGDQAGLESQSAYAETLDHLLKLLRVKPERILIDKHPRYFVSTIGKEKGLLENIPITSFQHHKAHFGAVLAENNLLQTDDPVLGIVWDGTGYGDDGQTWGGEIFIYHSNEMERAAHLDYFPHLLGDKMSREPRLSALSLLRTIPSKQKLIGQHFSNEEWKYFEKEVIQPRQLLTSSMGRVIDGLSSILGVCQLNSYEGEAAMKLEALASKHRHDSFAYYPLPVRNKKIEHSMLLSSVLSDIAEGVDASLIAWKIFCSLAKSIGEISDAFGIKKIAFSGGVFQNQLLVGLIIQLLSQKNELYFHHQLSPNDECIGFGQIACYEALKRSQQWGKNQYALNKVVHEQ